MANFQKVIDLWCQGFTVTDIAKRCRMNRSTIQIAIKERRLVLPERDWGLSIEAGIPRKTAFNWAKKGLITRSPSGLYRIPELLQVKQELLNRKCKATYCVNKVDSFATRIIFCERHRNLARKLVSNEPSNW